MKKIRLLLSGFFLVWSVQPVLVAQVTVGSDHKPSSGMLLELRENIEDTQGLGVTASRGLGLPRVELKDIQTETDLAKTMGQPLGSFDPDMHIGLVVYNIGKNEESAASRFCPGVHVWNGDKWEPLIPYPEIKLRVKPATNIRDFKFLSPTQDPQAEWPAGKSPGDYQVGYIGTFTDKRDNEKYTYARFYSGLMTKEYTVEYSCRCDPEEEPVWIDSGERNYEEVFVDGIWMNSNLKATKTADGTEISRWSAGTDSPEPRYYYPGNIEANKSIGVLYNWHAATNRENPLSEEQSGMANDDVKIQGVCPDGWRLPSDQEWTDLERALLYNSLQYSSFQNTPQTGAGYEVTYDINYAGGYRGGGTGRLGAIMYSPAIAGGKSKQREEGGFYVQNAVCYQDGSAMPDRQVYYWTASSSIGGKAWRRGLDMLDIGTNKISSGVYKNSNRKGNSLYFVRCIKE